MITDIIELNNFIVLIETSVGNEPEVATCRLDDDVVGIAFYASGEVKLEIVGDDDGATLQNRKGVATSFYGNRNVKFVHNIANTEPLRSVSVFSTIRNIQQQPQQERELYTQYLNPLIQPSSSFEVGPTVSMNPEMQTAILKIFNTRYENTARLLFLKSQVTELLSHYFGLLSSEDQPAISHADLEKIQLAREIITQSMDKPPSLNELSRLIGLNSNKLKRNFKELFGVPVFKYLQNERLQKAHQLLSLGEMTVQEVAWFVGYESVSSFSNAFLKKYGFRPSNVKG